MSAPGRKEMTKGTANDTAYCRPPLQDPEGGVRSRLVAVGAFGIASILFTALIVLNVTQMLSLVVRPFSRRAFRAYNRWAADLWWGWCVRTAQRIYGTRVVLTGDDLPPGENVLLFANHQQMTDITFLMFLARGCGRLGDMKWMLKKVLRHVPGIGWGLSFLDSVFLERDWTTDRDRIRSTFRNLVDNRVPVWLMTFPEGTRVTAAKLETSRVYQRGKGLPPLRHLLLPRTKGFVASVKGLRGHIDAVYDVTIGYEDGVPNLWQYTRGTVRVAHLHVRRHPVGDLPDTDAGLIDWIRARFQDKDAALAYFYALGSFEGLEG